MDTKLVDYKFVSQNITYMYSKPTNAVKPVCKGHSMEPEHVTFMWPLWSVTLYIQIKIICTNH